METHELFGTPGLRHSLRTLYVILVLCWLAAPGNPLWSMLLLYLAFLAHLIRARYQLPERVATHFGFDMQADGWMSRRGYLIFYPVFVMVTSLTSLGLAFWLRRAGADSFIARWITWFACALLGFLWGVHALVVEANRDVPQKLSSKFWVLLGALSVGIVLWVAAIQSHEWWGWPP